VASFWIKKHSKNSCIRYWTQVRLCAILPQRNWITELGFKAAPYYSTNFRRVTSINISTLVIYSYMQLIVWKRGWTITLSWAGSKFFLSVVFNTAKISLALGLNLIYFQTIPENLNWSDPEALQLFVLLSPKRWMTSSNVIGLNHILYTSIFREYFYG